MRRESKRGYKASNWRSMRIRIGCTRYREPQSRALPSIRAAIIFREWER
jgi:hypothetical protein